MLNRFRLWPAVLSATVLAAGLSLGSAAEAATGPIVQVKAKGSVSDVLAHLKKMVAANGMMVMGELHQGKVLKMTGLRVESKQFSSEIRRSAKSSSRPIRAPASSFRFGSTSTAMDTATRA